MKKFMVFLSITALSGCGTYLPELTSRQTLPLEVLVAQINCEFQTAVWNQRNVKGRTFLAGWQGAYNITLKSNETGTAKSLNNTFPFLPARNVSGTGGVGVGESTTANRTAIMKFGLAFDDVKQKPVCAKIQTSTLHPFITGRIGFEEWMDRVFDAAEIGGELQMHRRQSVSSVGHTFQFTIVLNANAGAGFIIGPAPLIGINANATIERLDDGSVDVTMAKPAVDPLPPLVAELTKQQRELVAKLEELIDQLKEDNSQQTAKINSLTATLGAPLSTLDPRNENQMRTFGVDERQKDQLTTLDAARAAKRSNDQQILNYRERIASIRPKVITQYRVLPPDRNPEIIYTNQQLVLERLNNSLRINP